jgi:ATP-dependent RNA helicase HelY
MVPRRGGKVVVLRQERGRGGNRALVLTQSREVVRLGPSDLRGPVRKIGVLTLPRPFAPSAPAFQREVVAALRALPVPVDESDSAADRVLRIQAVLEDHPLHHASGIQPALRAATQADRIEREIARLERRTASRNESLARQFDKVLGVLEAWGYIEGWGLSNAGELLARLNTEGDLVLAEALREGLLDDTGPAELAALVSCFTYQRRGPEGNEPMPPRRWPGRLVSSRVRAMERIWRDLNLAERDERLPEMRRLDPGFTAAVHAWAEGDDLGDVLEDEDISGGDFVRNVKQTIDLLRQIADVAPAPATAATARAAADACMRGVIAASSAVSVSP